MEFTQSSYGCVMFIHFTGLKRFCPPFRITGCQMPMSSEVSSRKIVPSSPYQSSLADVFFTTNYESPQSTL